MPDWLCVVAGGGEGGEVGRESWSVCWPYSLPAVLLFSPLASSPPRATVPQLSGQVPMEPVGRLRRRVCRGHCFDGLALVHHHTPAPTSRSY